MRSSLRKVAVACIVASALPQVAGASIALHVLLEHGAEHGRTMPHDSMVQALHGHVHSADTPEHHHPVTEPAARTVASHARGPLQLALLVSCGADWAAIARAYVFAAGDRPASPRPTQLTPSVLRI